MVCMFSARAGIGGVSLPHHILNKVGDLSFKLYFSKQTLVGQTSIRKVLKKLFDNSFSEESPLTECILCEGVIQVLLPEWPGILQE